MRSTKIIKICSSSLCTCLHHMVILRTRNKITDFFMILAWASPFNLLAILKRNIVSDYFNVILSHSFHPHIILATVISSRGATLIDNFLGKNSEKLTRASSGILIDNFSDHQPYFISIEGNHSYIKQPKYIKVSNQSPENIEKFKERANICRHFRQYRSKSWSWSSDKLWYFVFFFYWKE